jgi:heme iron utilization protein
MSQAPEARRLLRACRHAALATISRRLNGYPFASAVPFALDYDANPVMLLSRLAEHTKNIAADERTSLMVYEPGPEVQSVARLTLSGPCRRIAERSEIEPRYLRLFPNAAELLELDFDFYRITPVAVRYIGGFGSIHWLPADALRPPAGSIHEIEAGVIEHMNAEHQAALRGYCRHLHAIDPRDVAMVGLDCDGIDVRADGERLRIDFPAPVHDAGSVRAALAALAQESRA